MTDPAGYRETRDTIESATTEERQIFQAEQIATDRLRSAAEAIVQNVDPAPERLRELYLANLTTRPHWHPRSMGLTWMQRSPALWAGWYPEYCQQVAEVLGLDEKE